MVIPDDSARTERIGRVVASGLAQQKKLRGAKHSPLALNMQIFGFNANV